jgi:predicted enzyme related to lactoylglutathione lyase
MSDATVDGLPLGRLAYLYLGSADFDADMAYYRDVVGAAVVWNFARFGARVAAVRVAAGPLLLIADHRPSPSILPIWAVDDLDATEEQLRARGWIADERVEVPDGPVALFHDPSGNQLALLGEDRPAALEAAYRDDGNDFAVH